MSLEETRCLELYFEEKPITACTRCRPNVRRAYEKEKKKPGQNEKKEGIEPEVQQTPPSLEPDLDNRMRGMVWGILVALIVSGIAFLLSRLIP